MAHLVGGLLEHAAGHGFQVAVPALSVEDFRYLFPGRKGLLHGNLVPFLGVFHALAIFFSGEVGNQGIGDGKLLEQARGQIVAGVKLLFHQVGVQASGEILCVLDRKSVV